MANRKRKKKRSPTEGCHRSPDSKTITSNDKLYELVEKYISERGFIEDAKSFGKETIYNSEDKTSVSKNVPNLWDYHILVSIDDFNRWMDRNKNYYHMYINRLDEPNKLEVDSHVRGMLLAHNRRGASIGHITDQSYKHWYTVTFEREISDLNIESKKLDIELKKLRIKEIETLQEKLKNGDGEDAQVRANMEYLNNLLSNAN